MARIIKRGKSATEVVSNYDSLIIIIFILMTCIKLLLYPTYFSTDFEVHRNWLAITHSLPLQQWYTNEQSQWTLDYPPFFAWFEFLLSHLAVVVDPEMLKIENFNYASFGTIAFQRTSVICMDVVLAFGVREALRVFGKTYDSSLTCIILTLGNIGLLVVDHVHFQYNGFLLGILLLSMSKVSDIHNELSVLQGAFWFAVLLNLKHIFVYVAPAYVVWLLRYYCMKDDKFFKNISKLFLIVMIVFTFSFGPFISQLPQVISRLFPFKRGLVHAYWAANSWALYIGLDKALIIIWKYFGWLESFKSAAMTGGLVKEATFAILPTPLPIATFIITFTSMIPALWSLYFKRDKFEVDSKRFIRCIILCGLCSFIFGWHVHEKAILTAIIPLCILATTDPEDARVFLILSSAGHTALLPLLYLDNLTPLKLLLSVSYILVSGVTLSQNLTISLLKSYEKLYIFFLPTITIYETIIHKLIFGEKFPFLPLALTSVYCAVGVIYSWLLYYYIFLSYKHEAKTPVGNSVPHVIKRRKIE